MNLPKQPFSCDILLVEDNDSLAEEIEFYLSRQGYHVVIETNATAALSLLQTQTFDILLLDRMLPDGDSLDRIKDFHTVHEGYLIMLTALGMFEDRLQGLEAGADYYLGKPLRLQELNAIIQNLIRRRIPDMSIPASDWRLDDQCHALHTPSHQQITLTGRELHLLQMLMLANGENICKEKLYKHIYPNQTHFSDYESRRLDTAVYRLRKKIQEIEGIDDTPLMTIYGAGYAWRTVKET